MSDRKNYSDSNKSVASAVETTTKKLKKSNENHYNCDNNKNLKEKTKEILQLLL